LEIDNDFEVALEDVCPQGGGHQYVEAQDYTILDRHFYPIVCERCGKISTGWTDQRRTR